MHRRCLIKGNCFYGSFRILEEAFLVREEHTQTSLAFELQLRVMAFRIWK